MSRQRNVSQQNAATRDEILAAARLFLAPPPSLRWLASCLRSLGVDTDGGVLVQLSSCIEQFGNDYYATWLSDAGHFLELQASVPRDGGPIEVEAFEDVTDATGISAHVPGTGKSFGRLALDVLAELRPGALAARRSLER